ncbi:MAG: hypothetical protein EOO10_24610, partial [Chitinophagaceae bacterium]
MQAFSSSFETQQSNTTIFDGVKGEPGELSIDPNQTVHIWKSAESSAITSTASGFAFRKIYGDFIFTVQLKNQKNTEQFSNFGVQIEVPDS